MRLTTVRTMLDATLSPCPACGQPLHPAAVAGVDSAVHPGCDPDADKPEAHRAYLRLMAEHRRRDTRA